MKKGSRISRKPFIFRLFTQSTRRDSNPRPSPWQGDTPPLSHSCIYVKPFRVKRVMGIEPTYPAWKAGVLPLNYTRIYVKTLSGCLPLRRTFKLCFGALPCNNTYSTMGFCKCQDVFLIFFKFFSSLFTRADTRYRQRILYQAGCLKPSFISCCPPQLSQSEILPDICG